MQRQVGHTYFSLACELLNAFSSSLLAFLSPGNSICRGTHTPKNKKNKITHNSQIIEKREIMSDDRTNTHPTNTEEEREKRQVK